MKVGMCTYTLYNTDDARHTCPGGYTLRVFNCFLFFVVVIHSPSVIHRKGVHMRVRVEVFPGHKPGRTRCT